MDHEERIRQRAHTIWVNEGCLPGREQANWEQAKRELEVPNPGNRLETPVLDTAAVVSDAIYVGADRTDGPPEMGVDDLGIGRLSSHDDRYPSTGRSKLVG
ncbi:MAG: DUF2934 domain-containing protein [Rhizomicrobium sp.]|nr:DUF2934 domain-containing protein [Rhizomicrobium sp.]